MVADGGAPGAATPFVFHGCVHVLELVGEQAHTARELLEALGRVPDESVFHHTSGCLLQQSIGPAAYPNDFALWAGTGLLDRRLAERLAVVDPFDARTVGGLRAELVTVVSEHVRQAPATPAPGVVEPFVFYRSHTVPVATGHRARSLQELRDGLADVDASAIFFHVLEARFRMGRSRSDLAEWVASVLGQADLADQLDRIDSYAGTLERVRDRHLTVLERALAAGNA